MAEERGAPDQTPRAHFRTVLKALKPMRENLGRSYLPG